MPETEPRGCLFAIFRALRELAKEFTLAGRTALPYRRKDFLLSRAEASFFGVLTHVVGDKYLIFAKVRLADLLYLPRGTEGRRAAFNRIQSKHIDFVLCSRDGIQPLLAVELDDRSHGEESRILRDRFVAEVLEDAGLPLVRFACRSSYNTAEVKHRVEEAIRRKK